MAVRQLSFAKQYLDSLLSFTKSKSLHFNYGSLNRSIISEQLLNNGYCIYRDTGIKSKEDLISQHIEIFSSIPEQKYDINKIMDYNEGNEARKLDYSGKNNVPIITISNSHKLFFLGYHSELAYTTTIPKIVCFICLNPGSNSDGSLNGGMTPITDMYKVWEDIKENHSYLYDKLTEYGIAYHRNYPNGQNITALDDTSYKSWQQTFGFDKSKTDIENELINDNITFEWTNNYNLLTTQIKKPYLKMFNSDKLAFSNGLLGGHASIFETDNRNSKSNVLIDNNPKLLPVHTTFGDNTELTVTDLEELYKICNKNAICFEWKSGDVLIIDNIWWSHGRTPIYSNNRHNLAVMGIPMIVQNDGYTVKYKFED